MLATDSHNLTRLRHLLKTHHDNAVHEAALFQKLLSATILRDFQSAVRLVQDHFPRHLERLSGDLLFRIGVAFYQNADIEKARHCLELAAAREGSWQPKAMLLVSRTHEATRRFWAGGIAALASIAALNRLEANAVPVKVKV